MLISSGSAGCAPRRRTVRPSRRALIMLAFANAAAAMIPCAPASVVRTRAKLYDPREMSFAVRASPRTKGRAGSREGEMRRRRDKIHACHVRPAIYDGRKADALGSPGSSMDNSLGSRASNQPRARLL